MEYLKIVERVLYEESRAQELVQSDSETVRKKQIKVFRRWFELVFPCYELMLILQVREKHHVQ